MSAFVHTMIGMLAWMWISSCKQGNDQVLVKIGNKDSITIAELNEALKFAYGDDANKLSRLDKKNLITKLADNQLLFIGAFDNNLIQDSVFQFELNRTKENIIRQAALEKYVYSFFINDQSISTLEHNYGTSIDVQHLVIGYATSKDSKIQRSRTSAKLLADSIFSIASLQKFNALIETFSDNKDNKTGKGNIRAQRISPGKVPFIYEQTVFNSEPNTITKPIEVPGAFVIAKVVNVFKSGQKNEQLSRKKIAFELREKLEVSENYLLINRYTMFTDSLQLNSNVKFNDVQIDSFINLIGENDNTSSLRGKITADKILVTFGNDRDITALQLLNSYNADAQWKNSSRNLIVDRLKQMVKDDLLKAAISNEGFLESDEFYFKTREWSRQFAMEILKGSILAYTNKVPVEELRRYFEDNREQFSSPGDMKVLEVYSSQFNALDSVARLVEDKVDLVKAAEQINGKKKDRIIMIKDPSNYPDNQNDELVKKALSLKLGEVSKIFQRKDGGYSMIRLMEKNEKKSQPFDLIKNQVERSYRDNQQKKLTEKFLHQLKLKYPVVVYESKLK
ncbi:peptidyl-prolyl cis-trans isomerase [bacterium]|nr:peptidyl-prolyl cis-trans isomerase [bacterium]